MALAGPTGGTLDSRGEDYCFNNTKKIKTLELIIDESFSEQHAHAV